MTQVDMDLGPGAMLRDMAALRDRVEAVESEMARLRGITDKLDEVLQSTRKQLDELEWKSGHD